MSGAALRAAFVGSSWNTSTLTVSDGRWDAVQGYWAGGAPGIHGASTAGEVAYYFELHARSEATRAWFGSNQFFFAAGGHGWLRIDREVGGTFTPVHFGPSDRPLQTAVRVTEAEFLERGLLLSPALDFNATYHVYYVQERTDPWGGFVLKAVPGGRSAEDAEGTKADHQRAREAPVVSCGLFDDGAPPPPRQVRYLDDVEVQQQVGQTPTARFSVPLLNPQVHDGHGWELFKVDSKDPGYLRLWDAGVLTDITLKRGRVVQVVGGYSGNHVHLFTGTIADWDDASSGVATVQCFGVEQRLVDRLDKNYPDQISYMSANFRALTPEREPVYGIPAFDAWPLELALAECVQRGGLDPSLLRVPVRVPTSTNLWTTVQDSEGATVRRFRARACNGELIALDRPVHYGNAGLAYRAEQRADDAYAFRPEPSQPLWQRMRDMAERYGYDLHSDAEGALNLRARNNPYLAYPVHASPGYAVVPHPSAYAGQYASTSGVTAYTQTVTAARVDAAFGLGPDVRRVWQIRVLDTTGSAVYGPVTLTLPASGAPVWYYDGRYSPDSANACVVTLWSGDYGTYTVELTPVEGAGTEHRLNALFAYYQDPDRPIFSHPLSTRVSAERIQVRSGQADQRNHVIVVGRRKAAVTDSEKIEQNPENPEGEFVVHSAVDVGSVVDPDAANYLGYPRESMIYDDRITDQDYAAWVARTFMYRYAVPLPTVTVAHTLLPTLRLREPVLVQEDRFQSVRPDRPFYTVGFTHRWNLQAGARTEVVCTGYPEYPSYEPRVDVDVDTLFDGSPIANLHVQYTSLDGSPRVNLGPPTSVVRQHTDSVGPDRDVVEYVLTVQPGSPRYVDIPPDAPWPPVPGTIRFSTSGLTTPEPIVVSTEANGQSVAQALSPGEALTLPLANLGLGGVLSVRLWTYSYDKEASQWKRDTVLGEELGVNPKNKEYYYAVNYTAKALTLFRRDNPTLQRNKQHLELRVEYAPQDPGESISWLTNTPYHHFFELDYQTRRLYFPWQEGNGAGVHSMPASVGRVTVQYRRLVPTSGSYPAGSPFYDPYTSEVGHLVQVQFDPLLSANYRISVRAATFDGMNDTVVAWLTQPTADSDDPDAHWQYVPAGRGFTVAWDGVDQVGRWNQYQSELQGAALRGMFEDGRDEVIGKGFYVANRERAESTLAPLALIDTALDAHGRPVFGVGTYGVFYIAVEAKNGWTAERATPDRPAVRLVRSTQLSPLVHNGSTSAYCYTHLPAPTQIEVVPEYFWGDGYDPDAAVQTGIWVAGTPIQARITNGMPSRFRFMVRPRPGVLWTNRWDRTTVKLTRHAHLRAHVFDQFHTWDGTAYPKTGIPQVTVVSRRLTNDDHTWTFGDTNWRSAQAVQLNPWVFQPRACVKNFRGLGEQRLEYGNYLQLEEVPRWESSPQLAGSRSRFQLAFLNYLFYCSVYSQDRSGRRMWAINPTFLDRSKITNHNPSRYLAGYRLEHGDPPYLFQRRSVFTRQWLEPGWRGGAEGIGYGTSLLTTFLCDGFPWRYWSPPFASILNLATGGQLEPDTNVGPAGSYRLPSGGLGTWTWGSNPLWIPGPSRDFHGYRMMPPMGEQLSAASAENVFTKVTKQGRGGDPAAFDTWSSPFLSYDFPWTPSTPVWEPGSSVGTKKWEGFTGIPLNAIDVLHQDELVHYEDVRGSFSRGPEPGRAVRYTAPSSPYYINVYHYLGMRYNTAENTGWSGRNRHPITQVNVGDWFSVRFRHEYVWEAPTWFPATQSGGEFLNAFNPYLVRVNQIDASTSVPDPGAWTGWKDETPSDSLQYGWDASNLAPDAFKPYMVAKTDSTSNNAARIFTCPWPVLATGPAVPEQQESLFALSLVPERR